MLHQTLTCPNNSWASLVLEKALISLAGVDHSSFVLVQPSLFVLSGLPGIPSAWSPQWSKQARWNQVHMQPPDMLTPEMRGALPSSPGKAVREGFSVLCSLLIW